MIKRITLPWANYFRDLIDTRMGDKKLIQVFMKYAITQENELNERLKVQRIEDEIKAKKERKEHQSFLNS